jgi:hypothetical protein
VAISEKSEAFHLTLAKNFSESLKQVKGNNRLAGAL